MNEEVKIRTNFIGGLALLLSSPLLILALFLPGSFLFTSGMVLPAVALATFCFKSGEQNFMKLFTPERFRGVYVVLFAITLFLWLIWGSQFAFAWLISAGFFATSEPLVRHIITFGVFFNW